MKVIVSGADDLWDRTTSPDGFGFLCTLSHFVTIVDDVSKRNIDKELESDGLTATGR